MYSRNTNKTGIQCVCWFYSQGIGRTHLYEGSARRRDYYLHNILRVHSQYRHPWPPGGNRTRSLNKRAAAAPRLRSRCVLISLYQNTSTINSYSRTAASDMCHRAVYMCFMSHMNLFMYLVCFSASDHYVFVCIISWM